MFSHGGYKYNMSIRNDIQNDYIIGKYLP